MKFIYFDAKAGLSGDMILGALLDLGASRAKFKARLAALNLPVGIRIQEAERSNLRALKVEVLVKGTTSPARKWKDIESLIKKAPFSEAVQARALAIFENLFKAEAKVHGSKFHETHLHEAGADDALVDVLGCAYLFEELDISEFFASPLNVGDGWVKTSHGVLPVPPPAVAELLKGIPVYSAGPKAELVTPTGAAIVATLVKKFVPFPELTYEKIGTGAGSRDFRGFPNILRIFYGSASRFFAEKRVYLIETTIDDSNPQVLAGFMDLALERGALDVFLTPVVMKKNRLATKLTLMAELDRIDDLIAAVFRETSSIGVRYFPVERRALERSIKTVKVLGANIRIKVSRLEGKDANIQPEFSDCLKLARKKGFPVKEILRLAIQEYSRKG